MNSLSRLVGSINCVEQDVTHAIGQVPILVHRVGRRIFVNDRPFGFFESQRLKILDRFGSLGSILPLLENEIQAVFNHP